MVPKAQTRPGPQFGARLIVASNPERNDARRGRKTRPHGHFSRRPEPVADDWIWGWHAVEAALSNPLRGPAELILATPERIKQIETRFGRLATMQQADNQQISQRLPQSAVHQGVAVRGAVLDDVALRDFDPKPGAVLVMLDQVTDPQNVGAMLRSAAAFGAVGMVLQDRHAPRFTGALAKAAAGAVDKVPVARVVNLSRAIDELATAGWRTIGLAGEAELTLAEALDGSPTVLVMGSEGEGLRRLVADHCDALARIPMPGGFESLNVSAAAAVALYEASRPR